MNEMELQTTLDPIEMDMGDPEIVYSPVFPNPEGEPTDDLTKVQIQGNIYQIKDPEVHDWARAEEKPTYTKEEVGLGNVDDTSDMDKPVSTATQTALDNKVDKVAGKGLSEEDFTHTLKNKLDGIEAGAEVNTVNSVAGKTGNVTLDKSDVGLGNVDNTSDMNKPVSTATQTALNGKVNNTTLNNYYTKTQTDSALSLKADSSSVYTKTETDTALGNKVDKVSGKGLSTNDYDDTAKGIVDGVTTALSGKVDKEEGYGLSKNDYSDEEKAKVGEIDNKLDKTETAVNSNGLVIATPVTDTAPYIYRQTPVKESFKALMKKIVGASVVWNQLIHSFGGNNATISVNNNTCVVTSNGTSYYFGVGLRVDTNVAFAPTNDHKFIVFYKLSDISITNLYRIVLSNGIQSGTLKGKASTYSGAGDYSGLFIGRGIGLYFNAQIQNNETSLATDTFTVSNFICADLTAMFGTTIADYVYTLEQSETESGIAWLQSYGFFTEDYYAYKQNKLESGCVSAKKVTGFNQWDEAIEVGSIDNRSGNNSSGADRLRSTNYIKVISGKTYYFRSQRTVNSSFFLRLYDSNKTYITNASVNINNTYTIPSNVAYIRFTFVANTVGTYYNDICVNISDTAKNGTYAPYVEPTTYPISPITLRGLFKLSTDKLTVDGDEYNADGSVTRKYGIVDLGSLDWNYDSSAPRFMVGYSSAKPVSANSVIGNLLCEKYTTISLNDVYGENTNKAIAISTGSYISIVDKDYTNPQTFKTAMSGVYLIYELATPTTEQTTPFTETEIVGSTEEFIDYEVAQGNRDVAIPVGTETDYYQEMKLPSLPTTSGNHNLIYNPSTGFGWS